MCYNFALITFLQGNAEYGFNTKYKKSSDTDEAHSVMKLLYPFLKSFRYHIIFLIAIYGRAVFRHSHIDKSRSEIQFASDGSTYNCVRYDSKFF